jgi:hypothetical protein
MIVLLLAACSEYDVNPKATDPSEPQEDAAPDIVVEPLSVDFGVVEAGGSSEPAAVTVTNVGAAALGLDAVELAGGPFTLTTALGSALLAPGESTIFAVTYVPDEAGAFTSEARVSSNDPDSPLVSVALSGGALAGEIEVSPAFTDLGTLEPGAVATVDITYTNVGDGALTLSGFTFTATSSEMTLLSGDTGPGTLAPGEQRTFTVRYEPTDDLPDEAAITAASNDADEPSSVAGVIGNGRLFEGFSTGWYIVDDSANYQTTSNPSYRVDFHGDADGYWYEPSGARGLVGSSDPTGDFAILRDYVIARAGAPTPVTGPLNFRTSSSVPSLTYASYSYIVCDFWIDPADDPALFEVVTGNVDDGVRVIVNGVVLGDIVLGSSGRFSLDGVGVPGAVNTLAVILMDNAAVDKYLYDLGFYRDGVIVSG